MVSAVSGRVNGPDHGAGWVERCYCTPRTSVPMSLQRLLPTALAAGSSGKPACIRTLIKSKGLPTMIPAAPLM